MEIGYENDTESDGEQESNVCSDDEQENDAEVMINKKVMREVMVKLEQNMTMKVMMKVI